MPGHFGNITLRKVPRAGNDYLIYDPNRNRELLQERQMTAALPAQYREWEQTVFFWACFDGDKMRVRIFNPDGSEAERS